MLIVESYEFVLHTSTLCNCSKSVCYRRVKQTATTTRIVRVIQLRAPDDGGIVESSACKPDSVVGTTMGCTVGAGD